MRGIFRLCGLLSALILLLTTTSCTKLCDSGWEGGHCNIEVRAIFEGAWNAVDTPGNLAYRDTIQPAGNISGVTLSSSFANNYFMHVINASISGTTITIPMQQPDSLNHQVQGTGSINNNGTVIIWTYQLINATDSPAVTTNFGGTWTK